MERPANRASLKIAFFTDTWHPSHNGVVTSTTTFRRDLMDLGHQVHVFAPAAPGLAPETRCHPRGLASLPGRAELPRGAPLPPLPPRQVHPVALRHHPHPDGRSASACGARRWPGWPVGRWCTPTTRFFAEYSHYLKVGEDFGRAFAVQYSRLYCNRCRAIVVPSPEFIEVLRSYRITTRIEVIPTGSRSARIDSRTKSEARRRLGIAPDTTQLLYVGRLAREKSVDEVIDAVAALHRTDPGVRLALVGDGPYRPSWRAGGTAAAGRRSCGSWGASRMKRSGAGMPPPTSSSSPR
jgi:1,2-diacylglycerol 3-alpha-glucosyltransferase